MLFAKGAYVPEIILWAIGGGVSGLFTLVAWLLRREFKKYEAQLSKQSNILYGSVYETGERAIGLVARFDHLDEGVTTRQMQSEEWIMEEGRLNREAIGLLRKEAIEFKSDLSAIKARLDTLIDLSN